jgi:hypothetical protein
MNIIIKALRMTAAMIFLVFVFAVWFFGVPFVCMLVFGHNSSSWIGLVSFVLMILWILFAVSLSIDPRAIDKIEKIIDKIEGKD